jgi:hypothetical protein
VTGKDSRPIDSRESALQQRLLLLLLLTLALHEGHHCLASSKRTSGLNITLPIAKDKSDVIITADVVVARCTS